MKTTKKLFLLIGLICLLGCNKTEIVNPVQPKFVFETVNDINRFCEIFPNLEFLPGSLYMDFREMKDLEQSDLECFHRLRKVDGVVYIRAYPGTNLNFLSQLENVHYLTIYANANLDSLILPALDSIHGMFQVIGNHNLKYISTPKISHINDDVYIDANSKLLEWSGSPSITKLRSVQISSNVSFTSLSNFENLNLIEEGFRINYAKIKNYNVFEKNFEIKGVMQILSMSEQPDFSFFQYLKSVGHIYIHGKFTLDDLCPLIDYAKIGLNNINCYPSDNSSTIYGASHIIDNCR